MSHFVRHRPLSPGGKRLDRPMRSSTGTVPLGASYDPYDYSTSRSYDWYATNGAFAGSYTEPKAHAGSLLEARPIASRIYRDSGHSTKHLTEYAVRPRSQSHSVSDPHGKPPRIAVSSPSNRQAPVVTTSYERAPSPRSPRSNRKESERYLVPASSGRRHGRVYSVGYASDTGRLGYYDRAGRPRTGRTENAVHGTRTVPRYPRKDGYVKDGDEYEPYSYTNPREQFERESEARLKQDRSGYRNGRPVSMNGVEDYYYSVPRNDVRTQGPPPSYRGFGRLDGGDRPRHHGDSASSWRRSTQRTPVSLHQRRDDDYPSYREEYDSDHHHPRRHRHHREDDRGHYPAERSSKKHSHEDAAMVRTSTGFDAAVVLRGHSDESQDYDDRPPSRDRRRLHDPQRGEGVEKERHGSRYDERRRRSRAASRGRDESDSSPRYSSEDGQRRRLLENSVRKNHNDPNDTVRKCGNSSQDPDAESSPRRTPRSHVRGSASPPQDAPGRGKLEEQEDRKKPPIVVELRPPKKPETPPKGILKTPRAQFPEEPNSIREGVAPLKDAQKKGIPPGARWTKIDRRLVNPAALEAAHERFEARQEYVIVLRVLTKEEIQAFADKTKQIRDARYQAYLKERHRLREQRLQNGDSSSDDEDSQEPPLAIEAPPAPRTTSTSTLPNPQSRPRASSSVAAP